MQALYERQNFVSTECEVPSEVERPLFPSTSGSFFFTVSSSFCVLFRTLWTTTLLGRSTAGRKKSQARLLHRKQVHCCLFFVPHSAYLGDVTVLTGCTGSKLPNFFKYTGQTVTVKDWTFFMSESHQNILEATCVNNEAMPSGKVLVSFYKQGN